MIGGSRFEILAENMDETKEVRSHNHEANLDNIELIMEENQADTEEDFLGAKEGNPIQETSFTMNLIC